jgi:two-component system response regulator
VEKDILLVEDNRDDEALTIRAFRKNDIKNNIVVARDGVEALDYLFCQGEFAGRDAMKDPQLVLLDLKLPKVDGLEVLRRIRGEARTKLLPVVIFTSSNEIRDLQDAYRLGANSYICKPVNFTEFAEAVRQLALYWLNLNRCLPQMDA